MKETPMETTPFPTPTVTYAYSWVDDGPLAYAIERGRDVDCTVARVTELTVTEFPGTDEPPVLHASGRILTAAGKVDKRHSYSKQVWPKAAWLDLHLAAKAAVR